MLSENGQIFVPASAYARGTQQPYWVRNGLARVPRRTRTRSLGQWAELIGAAAGAYGSGSGGGSSPGGAGPGPSPMMPSSTNVSPTFQTQISPQISPVFQQTQGSPGATQAATTTQQNPGAQTAYPSAPSSGPSYVPPQASYPGPTVPYAPPLDPSQFNYAIPGDAGSTIQKINQSKPFDWMIVVYGVGALAIGAIAISLIKKRK